MEKEFAESLQENLTEPPPEIELELVTNESGASGDKNIVAEGSEEEVALPEYSDEETDSNIAPNYQMPAQSWPVTTLPFL